MIISQTLLEKYNKPVPRYTSYPPANFFKDNFSEKEYDMAIINSNNQKPNNISIYIHIPFCKKICHYCGCNNSNMRKSSEIRTYVDAIINEMKLCFSKLDKNRKISQIHYGGGTPNAIEVDYLKEINNFILSSFNTIENPEIAIECNPSLLDEKYIEGLMEAKFNRFSIGIQDFRPDVLKIINRDASYIPVKELISLLKYTNPKHSVNLDFIYGLPLQSIDSFAKTIEKAVDTKADRIVTFSYAHVPWVNKAQKILEKIGLPSEQDKINMFKSAHDILTSNNYDTIGLDHYALKTDSLSIAQKEKQLHRNFQGYCTRDTTGQVYAFGVSGITQLESAFIQNTKDIDEYIATINKKTFACSKGYILNNNETIIRNIIDQIMCNRFLNYSEFAELINIDRNLLDNFISPAIPQLRELAKDGIIEMNDKGIKVYDEHLLFIRNVAASFDPLLINTNKTFSKPV
ncbi:MAG: oxygen-independent coproporphyrinogen III oxidase [Marinifilaceae bacterium]|jgi:oxygen-independent coproporphyrinogen-3 oxidase|nr:oxygen-independent coproporphyrinogen III oxidase [Marinifilaceae bacterium]